MNKHYAIFILTLVVLATRAMETPSKKRSSDLAFAGESNGLVSRLTPSGLADFYEVDGVPNDAGYKQHMMAYKKDLWQAAAQLAAVVSICPANRWAKNVTIVKRYYDHIVMHAYAHKMQVKDADAYITKDESKCAEEIRMNILDRKKIIRNKRWNKEMDSIIARMKGLSMSFGL